MSKDGEGKRGLALVEGKSNVAQGEVFFVQKAVDARATEHSLSLRDAFRYYLPAIGWSLLFSLGVIMAGFDPQLIGTLVAIPQFQHGKELVSLSYPYSSPMSAPSSLILEKYGC